MSHIIIEGNLTADAEGGYGKESGKPWARLNVAVNNRVKSQDGSWTDGPTSFYRVTAFGSLAENAMDSLHKGDTVVVSGDLTVEGFVRQDGTNGVSQEITADHLGASLRFGTVAITKASKTPAAAAE